MEKIIEIRRRVESKGFIGKEANLVLNSLLDREPASESTEYRCNVLMSLYRGYNGTSKGVLNELKTMK